MWLNAGKMRRQKFFLAKVNPLTVFFEDFDHNIQDSFLNKSLWRFYSKRLSGAPSFTLSICNTMGIKNNRDGSRTSTASKVGFLLILVNGWKLLSKVIKCFIFDIARVLDMSRNNTRATLISSSQFYMYLYLRKKCVTEADEFKLVYSEKPVLETALTTLTNLCWDKIKIWNE